ncbi:hypothetical protein G9A89_004695 [Geosiphon pyriformis]|nr:hypothetical protein G9A89_004695 [Geosiphon pyriformis]
MSWTSPVNTPPPYGQPRPVYGAPPQRPYPTIPPYGNRPPAQPYPTTQPPPYIPPPQSPASVWTEHSSPDGRKYYYNTITKLSSWDKPDELKTSEERALGSCHWKEFTAKDGRKYYHNSVTSESKWDMPQEYKEFLERLEVENKAFQQQEGLSPSNGPLASPNQQDLEKARQLSVPAVGQTNVTPMNANMRSSGVAGPIGGANMPIIPPRPVEVKLEFETKEEAEIAFRQLLKESGVKPDWSWEQTMRAIITKPMYRALKTLAERKQAYQDYIDDLRRTEEEERRGRITKMRQDFISLLESHPEVNSSTRYRKVCDLFGEHPAFLAMEDDRQREDIFGEYVYELRKQEKEAARLMRKENMEKFSKLLRSLPSITMRTLWKDAQNIYMNTPEYREDLHLQKMDMLDFLAVFEEHIKYLEEQDIARQRRAVEAKRRQERKNRDAFRSLLEELRSKGIITAKSRWMDIYSMIATEESYTNILGQPGSTPLDLFWDIVEELDEILYQQRKIVTDFVKSRNMPISGISFEQFQGSVISDERCAMVSEVNMRIIFDQLLKKQEKKQRRKMDAFKSILKHFEMMITLEATWEQVRPVLEKTEEFHAIDNEEARIEVFDRFMERLKEKRIKREHEESEEELLRDDDFDEDRDRKRKHKGHRYHRRTHQYSDNSAESQDYSDRERDSGEKRKRRKKPKYEEHRYDDPRYQEPRYVEPRYGDSRHIIDSRHHDDYPPPTIDDYKIQALKIEEYKFEALRQQEVARLEAQRHKETPQIETLSLIDHQKTEEPGLVQNKHGDSSEEEGDKTDKGIDEKEKEEAPQTENVNQKAKEYPVLTDVRATLKAYERIDLSIPTSIEPKKSPKEKRKKPIVLTDPQEIKTIVYNVVKKYVESSTETELQSLALDDRLLKFNILKECTAAIGKSVPNLDLNKIKTVRGALKFFLKIEEPDGRKGHPVATWFEEHKDKLPSNMQFEPYVKERNVKQSLRKRPNRREF